MTPSKLISIPASSSAQIKTILPILIVSILIFLVMGGGFYILYQQTQDLEERIVQESTKQLEALVRAKSTILEDLEEKKKQLVQEIELLQRQTERLAQEQRRQLAKMGGNLQIVEERQKSSAQTQEVVLARVSGIPDPAQDLPALEAMRIGAKQYAEGRYGEAAKSYRQVIDKQKNNYEARKQYAWSLYNINGQDRQYHEEIRKNCQYVLTNKGDDNQALELMARVELQVGQLKEAQVYLQRLLAGSSDGNKEVQKLAGYNAYAMEDYENAISYFSRVLEQDSRDAEILAARGDSYLGIGKKEEALADWVASKSLQSSSTTEGRRSIEKLEEKIRENEAKETALGVRY